MSLKKVIERELHIPVRLRAGMPGSFDVFADGDRIYSKNKTGSLPTEQAILDSLRRKLS